jgi:hypothetical protein
MPDGRQLCDACLVAIDFTENQLPSLDSLRESLVVGCRVGP